MRRTTVLQALLALSALTVSVFAAAAPPADIKTIALLPVAPPSIVARNLSGGVGLVSAVPGMGILTAAIAAGAAAQIAQSSQGSKNEVYVSAYRRAGLDLAQEFRQDLKEELEKAGYSVVMLETVSAVPAGDTRADLAGVQTTADAVMAVRYAEAGYESPPFTSGWKSSVTVQTQLTRTGSAVDVQARTWGISPYEMRDRVNIVRPLDRKVYTSFEELLAHAADSFQQLLDQQHLLAQRVVLDLTGRYTPGSLVVMPATAPQAATASGAETGATVGSTDHSRYAPLTAEMLDNHTWMYPAADMQRLGYITLKFSEGQVYARNAIGTAQGDYAVQKNRLCMELRPWGRTCVHLEEDLDGMKVVTSKGYRLALQVR